MMEHPRPLYTTTHSLLTEALSQYLEREGQYRDHIGSIARHTTLHRHSDREAPPLRYRHPHKPHAGVRLPYGDVGIGVLRRRGSAPKRASWLEWPGVNPRSRSFHPLDSGDFQSPEKTHTGFHR